MSLSFSLRSSNNNGSKGAAWSSTLGLWVAVGSIVSGATRCSTSPDGFTWTARTSGFVAGTTIEDVVWCAELGLFVSVGETASGAATPQGIATSPNGTTWTLRNAGEFTTKRAAAYSPTLGKMIVAGDSVTFSTSTDAATWGTVNTLLFPSETLGMVWVDDLGLFVGVGDGLGATPGKIVTSPDGVTWTRRSSVGFSDVAWSPRLSTFVFVGGYHGGTFGTDFVTSPDAVTLTNHTLPNPDIDVLGAIIWIAEHRRFFALANWNDPVTTNTTHMVVSSTDGVTWGIEDNTSFPQSLSGATGRATALRNIAWSPELEQIIVCTDQIDFATGSPVSTVRLYTSSAPIPFFPEPAEWFVGAV